MKNKKAFIPLLQDNEALKMCLRHFPTFYTTFFIALKKKKTVKKMIYFYHLAASLE